jgi:hypothetical protein
MPTTHQAPGPHRPIHLYQPFAGPIPPASIDSRPGLPFGIPLNQSAPILQQFRLRENQASSTSEENRKRSIARNSNKTKRKTQVARAYEEPSASNPVDRNVSVLFFPLNVLLFCFSNQLHSHMRSPNPPARFPSSPTASKSCNPAFPGLRFQTEHLDHSPSGCSTLVWSSTSDSPTMNCCNPIGVCLIGRSRMAFLPYQPGFSFPQGPPTSPPLQIAPAGHS